MEALIDSLKAEWQTLVRLAPRLAFALLVLVLLIWIGRVVGKVVVKLLEKGKLTRTHKTFFKHFVTWSFAMLGIVIGLNLLGLQGAAAGLMAWMATSPTDPCCSAARPLPGTSPARSSTRRRPVRTRSPS